MNESNMQPGMMKSGGNKNVLIIAIIAIAIILIGFFAFNSKNNDADKDAMMSAEGGSAFGGKKDGEAMMEKGDAMAKHIVKYTGTGFAPAGLEIAVGETVTFVNESGNHMWVASAIHPTHELLPEFDQEEGTPNGSMYSFTFTKTGVWKFHDHLNPGMKGSVMVK